MIQLLESFQDKKLHGLYLKHGIKYLGLFGSAARGESTIDSDIDLLVDFDETKTLFELARLKLDLQDLFGKRVDLALKGSLKKHLESYIMQDLITVYEKN